MQHPIRRHLWVALLVVGALAATLVPLSAGGYFGVNGGVLLVDGTNVVLDQAGSKTILANDATANGASLSPDATKVAYASANGIKIACVPPASCAATVVPNTATGDTEPRWSPPAPDGGRPNQLAFVRGGNLWTIGVDGSGATQQTSGVVVADPVWSPDGTQIAYARRSGAAAPYNYEIWVLTLDGAQQQLTSAAGVQDTHPTWNPAGGAIAFQSNRSGTSEIYEVPSDGGTLTQVTNDAQPDTTPIWSPDGTTIAFVQGTAIKTITSAGGAEDTYDASAGAAPSLSDWQTLVPTPAGGAPTVSSGALAQGDVVTATHGSWNGAESYTYQFLRCDSTGAGCTSVGPAGAAASYTVTSADVGSTIRVLVFATNTAGTSSAVLSSNYTPVVVGPGPLNTVEPSITLPTGQTAPAVGSFVTGSVGTWTESAINTYAYQWVKCDVKDGSCYTIDGATNLSLLVTSDLFGWDLRLKVTATNTLGSRTAYSAATSPVTATGLVNTVSPRITGDNRVGAALTVSTGVWTGALPITYTYEWRRCNPQGDLTSCVPIPGAHDPLYVLTADDNGIAIRAYVTAHNAAGAVTAFTNHTFPIVPAPAPPPPPAPTAPASLAPPLVTGTAAVGSTLQAQRGTWSGAGPNTYRYAWQRCDAVGAGCRPIAGAHKAVYTVQPHDLGATLRVAVTATNRIGHAVALSSITDAVVLARPLPRARHIVGSARADYLAGGGGNDTILGLGGNDTILGGAGDDHLLGGPGNDVIDGGPGRDTIDGGPGNDTVRAVDGERDTIDCGPGRDRAIVDPGDVTRNCELVTPVAGTAATTP